MWIDVDIYFGIKRFFFTHINSKLFRYKLIKLTIIHNPTFTNPPSVNIVFLINIITQFKRQITQ